MVWKVKDSPDEEKKKDKASASTTKAKKNSVHKGNSFGNSDTFYSTNHLIRIAQKKTCCPHCGAHDFFKTRTSMSRLWLLIISDQNPDLKCKRLFKILQQLQKELHSSKPSEIEVEESRLHIKSDSLLVVNQMNGEFAAKDLKMTSYLRIAKAKSKIFKPFPIEQIPKDLNTQVDALANLGSALSKPLFNTITIVHLLTPSIDHEDALQIDNEEGDWSSEIMNYLTHDQLPEDGMEDRKIRFKASRYVVILGRLYRRSSTGLNL
ncbi:hypothetical protein L6452_01262 [Arctium lappa]|uniref:Uncharacterized protein n=1 Tax=Arctium lappa TaxID=4217 RepID=A0ACB9FH32_ARCLA|nr:hypothetical protein L6452_01262 [Arctium lappa]